MRIIISDASALIDLSKVRLLETLVSLPYEFVIPDVIFENELLRIHPYTLDDLHALGFQLGTLTGEQVGRAIALSQMHAALSTRDCFALVLAEDTKNSILLTGDRKLRACAEERTIETHGVIWACDKMEIHGALGAQALYMALRTLERDPFVHLPQGELRSRIRRLSQALKEK